ncbi:pilus assembly protein TadG-related protein [Noviherbaspirillum galbum]|uniref:Putative Flp pilus-assembly TadG-like N-terminal domain-containing protein n=1 Tax=Noviherbaspirillum galbum TaxID=2709383 RepID=A0A6B3SJL4_9BURK|nr:pilus assembly protein TadG-related protein [Noviherbaspirillum galbum]NEX61044.1 hypothetical protein [Noviherbaspirillum galbum]
MVYLAKRRRERGAVILSVALLLLFLLGFMGFALDFGHLFIVKTELQTAMDSCALAAAQELDGNTDVPARARNAGRAAGNLNRVNLQSANWSGMGNIIDADITFKDSAYAPTASGAAAKYAQCQHTQPNVPMWLLKAMGGFSGNAATYPATQNVVASAVATRASAQTACSIPVALKPKAGGVAPNYGFNVGEWVTLIQAQNAATGGEIGWANLDGSNSASETERELNGTCGTKVGDTLGTPGVQTSVADAWNARFGIYKNNSSPAANAPDFTGYSYTTTDWASGRDAFNDFMSKRTVFANCGTSVSNCESVTGLRMNGGFQTVATAGPNGEHQRYGKNRRLVAVPVVNGSNRIIDYACMLMLHPLSVPMSDAKLEFRGNAGSPGSPCTTNGIPGGTAGPLVPVLVR